MFGNLKIIFAIGLLTCMFAPVSHAQTSGAIHAMGQLAIADMARALDQIPRADAGDPAFLNSYRFETGDTSEFARVHQHVAFAYDNALAIIAFSVAGDTNRARRIADAFLIAMDRDRFYRDGRIRNAYRAGPLDRGAGALVPGWWDDKAGRWAEDAYQVGTATGSAAFVGMALLAIGKKTGDDQYVNAALSIGRWIASNTKPVSQRAGFSGGYFGHEPHPKKQTWVSVEHNIDAAAFFRQLGSKAPPDALTTARRFVISMIDPANGRLFTGLGPDGITINKNLSSADAMTLAVAAHILPEDAAFSALAALEAIHGTQGGISFSGKRDALWIEGSAQWAVALGAMGRKSKADEVLLNLTSDHSDIGYWRAIRGPTMSTGLSTGIDESRPDFIYLPYPHLAATAWVGIAAFNYNPLDPMP